MKKLLYVSLSLLLLAVLLPGCQKEQVKTEAAAAAAPDNGYVAYYFHSTIRCPSCTKIENYSHEVLETKFAGKLVWIMVNTDLPENEHFIEDFELITKSLVLVEMKDGEVARWKNCDKVWELLNDKDSFQSYVQSEVRTFLNKS